MHAPELLLKHFGAGPSQLNDFAVTHAYKAVAVDIAALKADPEIPGGFLVTGLVYDVATGRIEIAVPTAPLRADTPA